MRGVLSDSNVLIDTGAVMLGFDLVLSIVIDLFVEVVVVVVVCFVECCDPFSEQSVFIFRLMLLSLNAPKKSVLV